jgi:seryl-tRNA synthetase
MLDIKFIREHSDIVDAAAKKKHMKFDVKELLSLDEKRVAATQELDHLREEQNRVSKTVAETVDEDKRAELIRHMREHKEKLQAKEAEMKVIMEEWQALMLQVPNVPDVSVPEGKSDEDNQPIKEWGEKAAFGFGAKDHVELMEALNMADFERGVKVHGFRGYFLKGAGAELSWAIWNYARDFFGQKGFIPVIAPAIVRKNHFYGTGHLPNDAEDIFKTQDDDYLTGTAEVPMMGYHANEVLDASELPLKYLGFSPCYRREAGSHGKDTRGLIRVHEFYKLEQVLLCEASHEESVKWHEWINRNTEEFIESLNIPYRTVVNCGGDLGQGQVKKYDIELWVPGEEKYREISSASYFHDFQTRRFNIKYKDSEGVARFAHSLNCTAIPTPRILVSLLENFQQEDGTIKIPEALQRYMGSKEFIGK